MNAMHVRQQHDNDHIANMRDRNRIDDVRDNEGWFRNSRIVLLYFFAAFVIIRIWILVVATDNRVYISITAVGMGIALVFYLRWRRRYIMMLREGYANRQLERDIPVVTIQEFLNMQAAIRAAQNGGTVLSAGSLLPNNMPHLIASLPSIVYQPLNQNPTQLTRHHVSTSTRSSFILGTGSGVGSNKVVPTVGPTISTSTETGGDIETGDGDSDGQAPLCMVCLDYFLAGDVLTCLPCACGHKYHRVCLIAWLERKTTCPLCSESVAAMLLGPGTNPGVGPGPGPGPGPHSGSGYGPVPGFSSGPNNGPGPGSSSGTNNWAASGSGPNSVTGPGANSVTGSGSGSNNGTGSGSMSNNGSVSGPSSGSGLYTGTRPGTGSGSGSAVQIDGRTDSTTTTTTPIGGSITISASNNDNNNNNNDNAHNNVHADTHAHTVSNYSI